VGVDLAKQVFHVHGVDRVERPVRCQRLKRGRWIAEFERNVNSGCEIGMEARGGAHRKAPSFSSQKVTVGNTVNNRGTFI
jgi:transposase